MQKRKLIEVALPLEAINRESAREKSIRHGHPSTLHLWWARRPLAAARAVLFAQLVDDPSARPEEFPTEEAQRAERERLHDIIERLVVWENVRDERLLAEAHAEILKSTGRQPAADPRSVRRRRHDPAGGAAARARGARLRPEPGRGPDQQGADRDPAEVPRPAAGLSRARPTRRSVTWTRRRGPRRRRAGLRRVDARRSRRSGSATSTRRPACRRHEATVIAWIWARTVTCPNPACGIEMPLVRSWWLGKKKGKEAYVVPTVVGDPTHPSGQRVEFEIGHGPGGAPSRQRRHGVGRTGAMCVACGTAVSARLRSSRRQAGRMAGQQLMAVVAEGKRQRIYLAPSARACASRRVCERPTTPSPVRSPTTLAGSRRAALRHDQLPICSPTASCCALTTFSDLVAEARAERVVARWRRTADVRGRRRDLPRRCAESEMTD